MTAPRPVVAYLVRSFPRLSQTFVLDEILRLERLGADIGLFALEASGETLVHGDVARLRTTPEVVAPASVGDHLAVAAGAPGRYALALRAAVRQVEHEHGYHAGSRMEAFGRAVALARRLDRLRRARPVHLHAHFAHDPALVAQLVHLLTGVRYSFTAHARDVHQVSPRLLRERTARSEGVVACCAANAGVLEGLAPGKVHHVPHGVDTDTFRPPAEVRPAGSQPPLVMSVGRLVEKKGFVDLLEAFGHLRSRGVSFHAEVHGDGPLRDELRGLCARLGLSAHVSFLGARTREQLLEAYRRADVFALTPFPTSGGDVDGVPNVVLEAMACGLPVVVTAAGGVAEAVTPGVDGLLARPRDVEAVATHLAAVLSDADLRRALGAGARRTAVERFDGWGSARRLLDLFGGWGGIVPAGRPVGHDDGHVPVPSRQDGLGAGTGPASRPS